MAAKAAARTTLCAPNRRRVAQQLERELVRAVAQQLEHALAHAAAVKMARLRA